MTFIPGNLLILSILISSTIMAISSSNWLMMWASLELNLLAFIPLMMSTKSHQEIEASTKYFLSQALGSAVMIIFSIIMWSNLSNFLTTTILLMALLIKLGAAPCHFWFPSVMSSISWESCLMLTTWQKLAPLMIIIYPILSTHLSKMMVMVAPLNAIIGGLLGLNQTRLRSILAYSSITHTGWILAGVILMLPQASMLYFIMYIVVVTPLFMMMIMLDMKTSAQLNKTLSSSIILIIFMSILFLSLGGLPPLTGFMPKLMIIQLMMESSTLIILFLILGSLLNLFFYLNLSFNMLTAWQMHSSPNALSINLLAMTSMAAISSLGVLVMI